MGNVLELHGNGGPGVATNTSSHDGKITLIAHPHATKDEWDQAWNRLPDFEVAYFDYHIKPDGTEVFVITPGLTVRGKR